jgi:hypothetical protein
MHNLALLRILSCERNKFSTSVLGLECHAEGGGDAEV